MIMHKLLIRLDLIGTFCIVNLVTTRFNSPAISYLIGTFCIVNIITPHITIVKDLDLIGTFCIVNPIPNLSFTNVVTI